MDDFTENLAHIEQKSAELGKFTKLIIGLVVLSFLAGSGGGFLGFWFAQKRGFIVNNTTESGGTISQKLTLEEDNAVIQVVKKASPAVVSIVISKNFSSSSFSPQLDPFSPYYSIPDSQGSREIGAGSGFFVTSDGLIVTNKHVVADEAAQYSVVTNDGQTFEAKVLARDPLSDIAIVKVEISDAKTLDFVDSSSLEVGQRVVAIGNSLGLYQNTVTTGVISGIGRSIIAGELGQEEQLDGVIQTDAAINPGNSGGPLLNSLGQVVGINTAIDQEGQLVGFAIPSNEAVKAVDSFKQNGKITRAFLGVRYMTITKSLASLEGLPKDYGALIVRGERRTDFAVLPGGPADKAGLQENDIILECDGKKLGESFSLAQCVRGKDVGDIVKMRIYSKGEERAVDVTLDEVK